MKNGKIEIEKNRSQNFRWTDFHFDIALLPINGFGRNFVQNYTYFHCGGDGAGENPPFEALRCALRIRMSSIPPDSYIIRFLSHSRLTRLLRNSYESEPPKSCVYYPQDLWVPLNEKKSTVVVHWMYV